LLKSTKKQLNRWLSITYGYGAAQLHYLKIKPCIIAEELLSQSKNDSSVSPKSLIDYKIYCINGKPQIIWISYNRSHEDGVEMTMYDSNWEKTPQHLVSSDYYTYNEKKIPKPSCLQEMLEMSKKLSSSFPQLRVDLYVINNKPIIGELTFTTGFGFFTYDFYDYLGSKIDLNKKNQL
jgi:hypothetical protein